MWHLLLLSGLLSGVPSRGIGVPRETSFDEDQPEPSAVVILNDSCRDQGLWRVGSAMLRLLRLDRPPRVAADTIRQAREAWAKAAMEFPDLSSRGQHLNISSNQTLLIRRGSCTQISHRVTLDDLGWQTWVLHPNSFVFTECLGCRCPRTDEGPSLTRWIRECGLGSPSHQPDVDSKQGRCCRSRRNAVSFAFFKEDGSLVIQPVRMDIDCHCRV